MKYVVIKSKIGTLIGRYPIIFPNNLSHDTVAIAVCRALKKEQPNIIWDIESAGEAIIQCDSAHGTSITLQMSSQSGDKDLINLADYGGCFINQD